MKFESITNIFTGKKKKESYDLAIRIESLASRIMGMPIAKQENSRDLNVVLENTYLIMEKLEKRLEEESKRKIRDFANSSGFTTAKASLRMNGYSSSENAARVGAQYSMNENFNEKKES